MCGICGIITYEDYNPKVLRDFVRVVFYNLEDRGIDASGITVVYQDEKVWYRKAPVRGLIFGELIDEIKDWEKDVARVLIHCRQATQGSPLNNENNHPLWYYIEEIDELIFLVHNGVVQIADKYVISKYGNSTLEDIKNLVEREVDSDLLLTGFRLTRRYDKTSLEITLDVVMGSIALITTSTNLSKPMYVYRNSNPLVCTEVSDVGLVFISTEEILKKVINCMKRLGYVDIKMEKVYLVDSHNIVSVEKPDLNSIIKYLTDLSDYYNQYYYAYRGRIWEADLI